MVKRAEELAERHGWFLARQFENPANPAYHRQTTGPEILRDFAGRRLDYFVTGWGTGGTLTGVSDVIKVARPDVPVLSVTWRLMVFMPRLMPWVAIRSAWVIEGRVADALERSVPSPKMPFPFMSHS